MKAGGRPQRTEEGLSGRRLTVRLTDQEYEQVKEQAKARGVTMADVVRLAIVGKRLPPARLRVPELNRQVYAELARTTANLNQLTHAFNAGQLGRREEAELGRALAGLAGQIAELRRDLIGRPSHDQQDE